MRSVYLPVSHCGQFEVRSVLSGLKTKAWNAENLNNLLHRNRFNVFARSVANSSFCQIFEEIFLERLKTDSAWAFVRRITRQRVIFAKNYSFKLTARLFTNANLAFMKIGKTLSHLLPLRRDIPRLRKRKCLNLLSNVIKLFWGNLDNLPRFPPKMNQQRKPILEKAKKSGS